MNREHSQVGQSSNPEAWTVGRIIRWCEGYFRENGSGTARLDVELLLARVLNCSRVRLYVDWQKLLEKPELKELRGLVTRRAQQEPVAYILGEREFWSMKFMVNRSVLIPRPDTEILVEEVVKTVKKKELDSPRIVDIGTGSGNIACAIAKSLPFAKITATDISKAALEVAEKNAERLGLSERIEFFEGDLTDPLKDMERFDVIVSNPPYIPTSEWPSLSEEITRFEPEVALLDKGEQGLSVVKRLVLEGRNILDGSGVIICEIGSKQAESATALAREAGFRSVRVQKDFAGLPRVVVAEL